MSQLSDEDYAYLYNTYQRAVDTPANSAITGNHWLLVSVLCQLGYPTNNLEDAYKVAERLLWPSY